MTFIGLQFSFLGSCSVFLPLDLNKMAVHIFYLFLSYFILLGAGAQAGAIYEGIVDPPKDDLAYTLPDLPYGYSDLEPHIDEETLRVHHLGHHKAYTKKMNAAILEWRQAVRADPFRSVCGIIFGA